MIYIILAIILILAITGVVLYFTVFKKEKTKENSGKNWSFIKNENFKIQKDSNGHEYIECNILINSNFGEYKYIGMLDLINTRSRRRKNILVCHLYYIILM